VREVMPVAAIDDRRFAPGPLAARLQEALRLRSSP
jgi:branched-subunit amino acid aminotransferase/4-amino-4-deoxychorismate lyase